MAARADEAAVEIDPDDQLDLLAHASPPSEPGEKAEKLDQPNRRPKGTSLAGTRRVAPGGRRALPRLSVSPDEAAAMLGVSRDYFDAHVLPELRCVRRGRRILIPVRELQRWLESAGSRSRA